MNSADYLVLGISLGVALTIAAMVYFNRPLRCPICKHVQEIPAKRRGRYTCERCGAFWIDADGRKP